MITIIVRLFGFLLRSFKPSCGVMKADVASTGVMGATSAFITRKRKPRRKKKAPETPSRIEEDIARLYATGKCFLFDLLSMWFALNCTRCNQNEVGSRSHASWLFKLHVTNDLLFKVQINWHDQHPMPFGFAYLIFPDLCFVVAVSPDYCNNHPYLQNLKSSDWEKSNNYFPATQVNGRSLPELYIIASARSFLTSNSEVSMYELLRKIG